MKEIEEIEEIKIERILSPNVSLSSPSSLVQRTQIKR
jgi:hypothetical protein